MEKDILSINVIIQRDRFLAKPSPSMDMTPSKLLEDCCIVYLNAGYEENEQKKFNLPLIAFAILAQITACSLDEPPGVKRTRINSQEPNTMRGNVITGKLDVVVLQAKVSDSKTFSTKTNREVSPFSAEALIRFFSPITKVAHVVTIIYFMALSFQTRSAEFRSFDAVRSPKEFETTVLSDIKKACPPIACGQLYLRPSSGPVSLNNIRRAAQEIAREWNTAGLEKFLGERFYERRRLLDTITTRVPRDAKLRMLAVSNPETIKQFVFIKEGRVTYQSSIVSVRIRYQIEFREPAGGLVRLESRDEYILLITERVPKNKSIYTLDLL